MAGAATASAPTGLPTQAVQRARTRRQGGQAGVLAHERRSEELSGALQARPPTGRRKPRERRGAARRGGSRRPALPAAKAATSRRSRRCAGAEDRDLLPRLRGGGDHLVERRPSAAGHVGRRRRVSRRGRRPGRARRGLRRLRRDGEQDVRASESRLGFEVHQVEALRAPRSAGGAALDRDLGAPPRRGSSAV